jgi:hypothetical protein
MDSPAEEAEFELFLPPRISLSELVAPCAETTLRARAEFSVAGPLGKLCKSQRPVIMIEYVRGRIGAHGLGDEAADIGDGGV